LSVHFAQIRFIHATGADNVGPDSMRAIFLGDGLGQADDAPLGGAQRAAHRHAFAAGGAGDADDAAAFLLDHLLENGAAAEKDQL
jgi:hypothetical protein